MYLVNGTLNGVTDVFTACDSLSQAVTLKEEYKRSYGNAWHFSIALR